jgi:putative peptidoglycan lipid II flippase
MSESRERTGHHALLAATGIFLSRISGLVRTRVQAHYLGSSLAAAALVAALRIPNFLQNLFGEGVLSASFIPVYASLVGQGRRDEADRVAGAVFGLLAFAVTVLCALGVLATPLLVDAIAPGFHGATRLLAIHLVRIVFPGTGLLVMSAWCLGILNSHGRFFLSYATPVVWNGAIVVALLAFGPRTSQARLAVDVAWAVIAGSGLQLAVQLPSVLAVLGRFAPSLDVALEPVRGVLRNFTAVLIGRGVVQISAYIDTAYASLVSARALSVLIYAQTLYLLPVSLFGMSVTAAELPEMSRVSASGDHAALRDRISRGLERIAFFVVPSSAAFLLLGDVVAAAVLETGRFGAGDSRYAWYVLIGSSVGLLAQTMGRLYANAFYAMKDARTPLWFASLRVAITAVAAWFSVTRLPALLGVPRELGAVGITATTGLAAWIEYALLRASLASRLGGDAALPRGRLLKLWAAALAGGAAGVGLKLALAARLGARTSQEWGGAFLPMPELHPVATAALVLSVYGAAYFAVAHALGVPQAAATVRRVLRRRG